MQIAQAWVSDEFNEAYPPENRMEKRGASWSAYARGREQRVEDSQEATGLFGTPSLPTASFSKDPHLSACYNRWPGGARSKPS